MFGRTTLDAVRLPYRNFVKPGVRLLRETVTAIDPAARRVTTDGGTYEADFLVVALGADYDIDATPGLAEADEFYSVAGAERAARRAAHLHPRKGADRRLRRALQMPAGAERVRLDAARLSRQSRRPRRLRDQLRAAAAEPGSAVAGHLAGARGGFRRARHQVHSRPPRRQDRQRPQGRHSR